MVTHDMFGYVPPMVLNKAGKLVKVRKAKKSKGYGTLPLTTKIVKGRLTFKAITRNELILL